MKNFFNNMKNLFNSQSDIQQDNLFPADNNINSDDDTYNAFIDDAFTESILALNSSVNLGIKK